MAANVGASSSTTDLATFQQESNDQRQMIDALQSMLGTFMQSTSSDDETRKTMTVFQNNLDKLEHVIEVLVESDKQKAVELVEAESKCQQAEKVHQAYVQNVDKLIQELRAQNQALERRVTYLEGQVSWMNSTWTWFCGQYTNLCNTLNAKGVYP